MCLEKQAIIHTGNNERIGMKEGNASEHEGRKKGGGEMKRKFVCKRNWGKKIGSS